MKTHGTVFSLLLSLHLIGQADSTTKPQIESYGIGLQGAGPGWFFPTGSSQQKINPGRNFNPSFLVNLKKIRFMLSASELSASIKDNFNYKQEYLSGRNLKALSWELSAGYAVIANKFVTVIPMVGTGFSNYQLLNPASIVPFDKTVAYWTCSFRTAVDLNIFRAYTPNKNVVGSFFIRLMGGYYPLIYQNPYKINGGAAFASITAGMQFGALPRQNKKDKH